MFCDKHFEKLRLPVSEINNSFKVVNERAIILEKYLYPEISLSWKLWSYRKIYFILTAKYLLLMVAFTLFDFK